MAISVKHPFVCAVAEGADAAQVRTSNWNEEHTVAGAMENPMTTAGDIVVGGISGAPGRLALGSALQELRVNAAGTGLEYAPPLVAWATPTTITDTANLAFGSHNIVSVTSAGKTLTLPNIASSDDYGKMVVVEVAAATTKLITVDGYATQLIDGVLTRVMWASEVAQLVATANGWTKVGGKSIPMLGGVYAANNQVITATVVTKIVCDTTLETSLMSDSTNRRVNILRPGIYTMSAFLRWSASNATSSIANTYIKKNGATFAACAATTPVSIAYFTEVAATGSMTTGDYIELYGYYASGSFAAPSSIVAAAGDTYIKVLEVPTW